MKIAIVALPCQEDTQSSRIAPPLPLAYAAALLEQRRHIVRIYDLALHADATPANAIAPVRSFRPHMIVLTGEPSADGSLLEAELCSEPATIVRLDSSLREDSFAQALGSALRYINENTHQEKDEGVLFDTLLAFSDKLDMLPYPARHLLPLEQYPLRTIEGELQTTICIAQHDPNCQLVLRKPEKVLAELQSIVREHGIRHFVLVGAPLTSDAAWADLLLRHLAAGVSNVHWEAVVDYTQVTPELLNRMKPSGCETICFKIVAGETLISHEKRAILSQAAQYAHDLGISVRADIELDPPFNLMPSLIDVSATLGLDAVQFAVQSSAAQASPAPEQVSTEELISMARLRYRSSRSRQSFITRFGPQFGPVLWRASRAGLLGRSFQRYADGADENALAY